MRWLVLLIAVLLTSCSATDAGPGVPPASGEASAEDQPADEAQIPHERVDLPPLYNLAVSNDLPAAHAAAARTFVRFANSPSAAAAASVPFSDAGVRIVLSDTEKHLSGKDLPRGSAWFLTDGQGTTSALFAISNSIKQTVRDGGGAARLLATGVQMQLCNTAEGQDRAGDLMQTVFISLAPTPRARCAPGYRVAIDLDADDIIQAVRLAVRAP